MKRTVPKREFPRQFQRTAESKDDVIVCEVTMNNIKLPKSESRKNRWMFWTVQQHKARNNEMHDLKRNR